MCRIGLNRLGNLQLPLLFRGNDFAKVLPLNEFCMELRIKEIIPIEEMYQNDFRLF